MERLDKETYLKRVIVVCWIALAICFGIKLFGGNLFEIMCENENFIKVCNYADNHFLSRYLLYFVYCFVSLRFLILAMIGKWKFTRIQFIVFSITVLLSVYIKDVNSTLGLIFDIWQGILMPIIFTWKHKKRFIGVVIGNVALVVFQLMSLFIRNLSIDIITVNGALISTIFSIDIMLMNFIYYLYSNIYFLRKEKENGSTSTVVSM